MKILLNRLIRTPEESKLQQVLLAPLGLLSFFYGWVLIARAFFYRRGIYETHSLPWKVISVGNITLGGTGKTPFVGLLAEIVRKRGYRTAVLSRGYKGKFQGPYEVVSDGERVFIDAAQSGDEPCLLAEKLKGVPIIVGRERWVSGQLAVDRFHTEVIILDDGFQHLSLKRDLNLLLVDSSCPFGNEKLFPRGILREPLNQITRADAIILTKARNDDNIEKLKKKFSSLGMKIPIFRVNYKPGEMRVVGEERAFPPESLEGRRILAFSGIAQPESFEKTLLDLKTELVRFEVFPDHHEYRGEEMGRLQNQALRSRVDAMVTTEKDLVRLRNLAPGSIPLWVLSVDHDFQGEDQSLFEAFLWEHLGLKS
ncbi:MAG TPA: tetraacyldisaccharide 4'-kinase [Thermodesulfobacteriota bacterium]|nr:tetraacyldisaccharide 4'-kinase [Thermodesulfobacteriota bacterium]